VDPQLWWHLARASGLTAWALLSVSVLWGLFLSTRVLGTRPTSAWLLDLHRLLGALTVVFLGVHMASLYLDKWIDYGLTELLVPLSSEFKPWAVTWGVVTMYLLVAIAVTSWIRPWIPDRAWRWIHRTAFVAFVTSTVHALQVGTDRRNPYVVATVAAIVAAFVFLGVYRLLAGRRTAAAPARRESRPPSSGDVPFHALAVREVRAETADSVSIAFEVPGTLAPSFGFKPGQFLTLRATLDDEDLRRPYSICSGITDGELRIAVRQAGTGTLSAWLTAAVEPGTRIEVSPPQGRFTTELNPLRERRVLGVAAGSGVTPVLSILRSLLAIEPRSSAVLLLGNRDADSVMLRGELAAVDEQAAGRLRVVHLYSRAPDRSPREQGRIEGARLKQPDFDDLEFGGFDEAFLCGPRPMLADVRDFLEASGLAPDAIHSETFDATQRRDGARSSRADEPAAPAGDLTIVVDGVPITIPALAGETVLETGLRHGLDLPYSCLSGACGTCVARVLRGGCDHGAAELSPGEKERGEIRTCSAIPSEPDTWVEF